MQKTVLITGASGGIGEALSRVFARQGHSLILVARSEQKLCELSDEFRREHNTQTTVLPADLSVPGAAQFVYDSVKRFSLPVDILVNNAGFGWRGEFANAHKDLLMNMLQVNVASLVELTTLFLPDMLARNWGRILNVGSTASFSPTPSMTMYGATKAFVLSFSEGLHQELSGTGVRVTALCPGFTQTGFQQRAHTDGLLIHYAPVMTADKVADIGYQAVMRGRGTIIPGPINQLLVFLIRFSPRPLTRWVVHRLLS